MSKFKFLLYSFVFYIIEFIIMGTQPRHVDVATTAKISLSKRTKKKKSYNSTKKIEKKMVLNIR